MKQLIIALMIVASSSFGAIAQTNSGQTKTAQSTTQATKQTTINVQGSCGMCKTNIEKAATSVKGVTSAVWNIKTKELQLSYNPAQTNPEAVSKAIARAGYDAGKYKADQSTYDALPSCCKYRK